MSPTVVEEYDPYLYSFLRDIGFGITCVFRAVEICLGIGYFIGSQIVEALLWLFASSASLYQETSTVALLIVEEISEFWASFARAILFLYYAVLKIGESFYITGIDLYNLGGYVANSLSKTICNSLLVVFSCGRGVLTGVPLQVVDALSLIGESAKNLHCYLFAILVDFLYQVVVSPINAILTISSYLVKAVTYPVMVVYNMPPESFIGLLVVLLSVFVCRRLIRYLIFRNARIVFSKLVSMFSRLLSVCRCSKLKNILTYSVTSVISRDQGSHSVGSAKVTCVICQDKSVSYMSIPCKHVCLCDACVHDLVEHDHRCPICRGNVVRYEKVFIP
ncbi:unnamed protein product [Orchesella dallaii]|uniref:RING-type domain-containing protein n=1 Tax=Orchesella dallaii TaxID=48710 RepID=A0ABP1PTD9_9HEXA